MLRAFLFVILSGAACAQAPQPAPAEPRKPARMLPADRSAILLRADREALERPEEILDRMGLKPGQLVADLGTGVGWYTQRIAKRVAPHGAVFAVDVQQGMLDQMQARMKDAGIRNVLPVLSGDDDPRLPPGKIDWVLLVDVYHELQKPQEMLAKIREALAPDGRVALVEYRAEQDPKTLPVRIPRDHQMTIAEVLREWLPAGFELVEFHEFLPAQHFFVFRKAGGR
jgi:ubiquinone/menaquinone biosynthesis C-methylase UbiE